MVDLVLCNQAEVRGLKGVVGRLINSPPAECNSALPEEKLTGRRELNERNRHSRGHCRSRRRH